MAIELLMITGIAVGLSAITNGIRKVVLKKEDLERMAEVQAYNRELLAAQRKKDQKTIQKLQKRKEYIQKANMQVTKKNMIVMFSSFFIFIVIYPFVASFFPQPVGVMPTGLDIPFVSRGGQILFYGWFILSFFGVSGPLSKAMGVSLSSGGLLPGAAEKPEDKKPQKEKQ